MPNITTEDIKKVLERLNEVPHNSPKAREIVINSFRALVAYAERRELSERIPKDNRPATVTAERIEFASMRCDGYGVFIGKVGERHHEVIATIVRKGFDAKLFEQGFWTTLQRFVDRKEGLAIAKAAGQIKTKHGNPNLLFSEDLW